MNQASLVIKWSRGQVLGGREGGSEGEQLPSCCAEQCEDAECHLVHATAAGTMSFTTNKPICSTGKLQRRLLLTRTVTVAISLGFRV